MRTTVSGTCAGRVAQSTPEGSVSCRDDSHARQSEFQDRFRVESSEVHMPVGQDEDLILDGPQLEEFHAAMLSAFPKLSPLKRMLKFRMKFDLVGVNPNAGQQDVIFDLL